MSNRIDATFQIVVESCSDCGVLFGIEEGFQRRRREDHKTFYCPNGHSLVYRGQTEADKLRKELERSRQREQWAQERAAGEERRAQHAERRLAATKGVVTKMKKRVGAGVCPCCNRHFSALQHHIETKHPEFVKGEEA